MPDIPKSSPILRLDPTLPKKELDKIRDNLSAVVLRDEHAWLGGDEGTMIHPMTRDGSGNFDGHKRFELKDTLKLPAPAKEEIDVEGLDVNGGYLWAIGSHSAKRKKRKTINRRRRTSCAWRRLKPRVIDSPWHACPSTRTRIRCLNTAD